jgi:hypothetical protein
MKHIIIIAAGLLLCREAVCQEIKMIMDRGDSVYYSTKVPENLKSIFGTYRTSNENEGFAVLQEEGKGTYRYPGGGFVTKSCPIEIINIIEWGFRCDKKGKMQYSKNNGVELYAMVLISNKQKFEACYSYVKCLTFYIEEGKFKLGLDTRWEKQ